jgi:hypothetical protein
MDDAPRLSNTPGMRMVAFGMRAAVLAAGVASGFALSAAYLLG